MVLSILTLQCVFCFNYCIFTVHYSIVSSLHICICLYLSYIFSASLPDDVVAMMTKRSSSFLSLVFILNYDDLFQITISQIKFYLLGMWRQKQHPVLLANSFPYTYI